MRNLRIWVLCLFILLFVSGCSGRVSDVHIDLGKSDIYTQDELKAAADTILNEIKTWDSVKTVYSISYCGDDVSTDQLAYCNSLSDKQYTQCVVFESSFMTAGSAESGGFNPNDRYDGWLWYLAGTDGGQWELLTWGYA